MEERKTSKKPIIIGAFAAVAVVAVAVTLVLVFSNKAIRATTMRMLRMEGTVTLEENGKAKAVREDLRLKSGNAVNTEVSSLCSIGLDDFKIVTMNEISRAEFNKKGKALNLNLTQGSLFFEVDKKLASDESFEIQTSTMVVGIRGTSGYVSCDEGGNESVIITDGQVHIVGKNPVTGEVKEIDVPAGSKISVYLYNDREVDSIMFEIVPVKEEDIPQFVTERLRENLVLLDRVVDDTGWSKPVILGEVVDVQLVEVEDDETPLAASIEPEEEEEEETEPEEEIIEEVVEEPVTPESTLPDGVVRNADGTYTLADGTVFDPNFYRDKYGDLAGMTDEELLNHYLNNGKGEERSANQAEQDAKDAEAAAKKALEEAQNNSGDDGDDSSSSSSSSNSSSSDIPSYTSENGVVVDNGVQLLKYDEQNQVYTVTSGTVSAPCYVDGNKINFSDMQLNNETYNGATIKVGNTEIVKKENGYNIMWKEAGGPSAVFVDSDTDVYHNAYGVDLDGDQQDDYTGHVFSCNDPNEAYYGQNVLIEDDGTIHLFDQQ